MNYVRGSTKHRMIKKKIFFEKAPMSRLTAKRKMKKNQNVRRQIDAIKILYKKRN